MKKIILAFFSCIATLGVFAQVDSVGKKMIPPDQNTGTQDQRDDARVRDSINYNQNQKVQPADNTRHGNTKQMENPVRENPVKVNATQDGVMRRDGKMLIVKNGQATE